MVHKKTDKEYLMEAAIELFSKKDIAKVSVREICAVSSTSTRTYYNYFRDKNDIVAQCFVEITRKYYTEHKEEMTLHSLLMYMAEEVCSHAGFFRHAFAYKGQNNIRFSLAEPLHEILTDLYRRDHPGNPDASVEDAMNFFIRGMLAYVEEAITLNEIPSAEKSVAFFENALPAVLKHVFS